MLDTNVLISAMRSDRGPAFRLLDLEARARRGSRDKFEAVLRKVSSGEPDPWDRWEDAEPFDRLRSSARP